MILNKCSKPYDIKSLNKREGGELQVVALIPNKHEFSGVFKSQIYKINKQYYL